MAKRVLKYAILGLLYNEQLSGYDITSKFQQDLSEFWNANHSQIYTELKSLLKEGLIDVHVQTVGEKMEKKVYETTSQGKQDFKKWLSEKQLIPQTEKDTFSLKTFFSGHLTRSECRTLFDDQLKQRLQKRRGLEGTLGRKYPTQKEMNQNLGDYLVLRKAVLREESYTRWLEEAIGLLED